MPYRSAGSIGVATLIFSLSGCADPVVEGTRNPPATVVDIEVVPSTLEFGPQSVDASASRLLTITNLGNRPIGLADVMFPPAFSMDATVDSPLIDPGEQANVRITWDVTKPSLLEDSLTLMIETDGHDIRERAVPITGQGKGPNPVISVTEHDLETVPLGCEETLTISASNAGNEPMYIDSITLRGDADFTLDVEGARPWVVPPFSRLDYAVRYAPTTVGRSSTVATLDTDQGPLSTRITGAGEATGRELVEIAATKARPVAVLVFANAAVAFPSGGFASYKAQFDAGLPTLFDELKALNAPYRVGFIWDQFGNMDGGEFIDESISSEAATAMAISMVANSVATDNDKVSDTLSLGLTLQQSWIFDPEWTGSGGFYADPKIALIGINDDADQSGVGYTAMLAKARSYVSDPDSIVVHGIGGPPGGCGSAVDLGNFRQAIAETGGTFRSICELDWAPIFRDMARNTVPPALGRGDVIIPIQGVLSPGTVEVTIDDELTRAGWWVDSNENAIVLDGRYAVDGTEIRVTYNNSKECGG